MIGEVTKICKRPRRGKPYGFVTHNGVDFYFNELEGVTLGMTVEFEGEKNEKGNLASRIRPIT